ncbi:MAG: hypothetical protein IKE74_00370 [Mogibacterium sp.]|nr:hypothetical protein [Mogibacterium sp.]
MAGIWETDVYRYYTEPSYARPRKIVDNLKLDWLDLKERYYSPEVEFFTKEEILERSGWSEDEVRILFYDRRFPSCNYGRKEVVEIHALIGFFEKKERTLRRQELEWETRYDIFTHLRNE